MAFFELEMRILMLVCLLKPILCETIPDLRHFELLPPFNTRTRRSVNGDPLRKDYRFSAFGRTFLLHMKPDPTVFATNFRAYSVDSHGVKRRINFDTNQLYSGVLEDDLQSEVFLFDNHSKSEISGSIVTKDDIFFIEPARRFLPKKTEELLIYKATDVKGQSNDFCEAVDLDPSSKKYKRSAQNPVASPIRQVADSGPGNVDNSKNTCTLLLVADYRFFEEFGEKDEQKTMAHMIGAIQRVNSIYRNTVWDSGGRYNDYGFQIKDILVHSTPTPLAVARRKLTEYNVKRSWTARGFLDSFSRNVKTLEKFCLAHLFTFQKFEKNILGLAYIAPPFAGLFGGACSPQFRKRGAVSPNTGWSSYRNAASGARLLTKQGDLVTAHELGHNMGSQHDDPSSEIGDCAPKSGGKYLMWPYSVSGYEPNNRNFSPCSRRFILAILTTDRLQQCLTETSHSYCGNRVIEGDEECDSGIRRGEDRCCTVDCKLVQGAVCSPENQLCCTTTCQAESSTKQCRIGRLDNTCSGNAYCNGVLPICNPPSKKGNGSICGDEGQCQNGECLSFCSVRNQLPCDCEEEGKLCMRCCRLNATAPCRAIDGKFLPAGHPCVVGMCNKDHVCKKQIQDLGERLWEIIEQLNPDMFLKTVKANIVGTVCLFTALPWLIVVHCVINKVEKLRQKREEEEMVDFKPLSNPGFIIRPSKSVYRKMSPAASP